MIRKRKVPTEVAGDKFGYCTHILLFINYTKTVFRKQRGELNEVEVGVE